MKRSIVPLSLAVVSLAFLFLAVSSPVNATVPTGFFISSPGTAEWGSTFTVTGSVTPSDSTGNIVFYGVLGSAQCALSNGSCSTTFVLDAYSLWCCAVQIGMTFQTGNTSYATSTLIGIIDMPQNTTTPANIISSTLMSGGTASLNQTSSTGVVVSVEGSTAPNGTNFTVFSEDLGAMQPNGTGSISLSSVGFFDARIEGIRDGIARICITDGNVSSTTAMQYWVGKHWARASNETVTGSTICGTVPVSAMTGTPLATGTLMRNHKSEWTTRWLSWSQL